MSISLRNLIVELFAYSNTGTAGFPTTTWTLVGKFWGRQIDWRGDRTAAAVGGAEEEKVTSIIALGDDAPVDPKMILRVQGDQVFKVIYVHKLPLARELQAFATFADKAVWSGLPAYVP